MYNTYLPYMYTISNILYIYYITHTLRKAS